MAREIGDVGKSKLNIETYNGIIKSLTDDITKSNKAIRNGTEDMEEQLQVQEKIRQIWQDITELKTKEQLKDKDALDDLEKQMRQQTLLLEVLRERGREGTVYWENEKKSLTELQEKYDKLSSTPNVFTGFKDLLEKIDKGSEFVNTIKNVADSISSFVFEMKRIELGTIQSVGSGLFSSSGSTYSSAMFSKEMKYEQAMLENQAQMTKSIISLVGTVVGGGVGAFGGGVGAIAGAGIGGSVMGAVAELILNSAKEMKIVLEKYMDTFKSYINFYQSSLQLQRNMYLTQNLGVGTGTNIYANQQMLQDVEAKYMGVEEMQSDKINALLSGVGMTRQFQGMSLGGGIDMARNLTGLSKSTGLGREEILGFFGEMRMRLGTPVDELAGRFEQLNMLSKDLAIPLKTVISDFQSLVKENQRMGFTQEELMGTYLAFGSEIKKGTISVGELASYMMKVADLGRDKTVGIGALLGTMDKGTLLSGYKGDKQNAGDLYDLLTNASPLDTGTLISMVSNPTANYSQDKKLSGLMKQYGLTQKDLVRMFPEMSRLGLAGSEQFGSMTGGDLGTQKLVEELFAPLMGGGLDQNFFKQMQQKKTINTWGTSDGVTDMGSALDIAGKDVEKSMKQLESTTNKLLDIEYKTRQEFLNNFKKHNDSFKGFLDAEGKLNSQAIGQLANQIMEMSKIGGMTVQVAKMMTQVLSSEAKTATQIPDTGGSIFYYMNYAGNNISSLLRGKGSYSIEEYKLRRILQDSDKGSQINAYNGTIKNEGNNTYIINADGKSMKFEGNLNDPKLLESMVNFLIQR